MKDLIFKKLQKYYKKILFVLFSKKNTKTFFLCFFITNISNTFDFFGQQSHKKYYVFCQCFHMESPMSCVTCQVSHIMCHVSGVTYQVSRVRCQVLGVHVHIYLYKVLEVVGGGSVIIHPNMI